MFLGKALCLVVSTYTIWVHVNSIYEYFLGKGGNSRVDLEVCRSTVKCLLTPRKEREASHLSLDDKEVTLYHVFI